MWELQRKCIFIEKKLQKDLVESEKVVPLHSHLRTMLG